MTNLLLNFYKKSNIEKIGKCGNININPVITVTYRGQVNNAPFSKPKAPVPQRGLAEWGEIPRELVTVKPRKAPCSG